MGTIRYTQGDYSVPHYAVDSSWSGTVLHWRCEGLFQVLLFRTFHRRFAILNSCSRARDADIHKIVAKISS